MRYTAYSNRSLQAKKTAMIKNSHINSTFVFANLQKPAPKTKELFLPTLN